MHTIKYISDNTVSSTTPDTHDPHDLMGKVSKSIETLHIILYQVISCKSKLDQIFRQLSQTVGQFPSVLTTRLCALNNPFLTVQWEHIWTQSKAN